MRRSIEAFNKRDVEAMAVVVHPELEFHSAFGAMEGKVYRGYGDIPSYFEDIDSIFEDWHTDKIEYHPAPDGRVVVTYNVVGRGRGSGLPIDTPLAIVWEIRDGLLWKGEVYLDHSEALRAAGLRL